MFEITISLYWKRIILKAQDKIFCNEHFKSTLAVSVDIFAKIRACFWCTWWFNKTQIILKKCLKGWKGRRKIVPVVLSEYSNRFLTLGFTDKAVEF